MGWIPQLDAIFSHVVSQWTYRWLALPSISSEGFTRLALEDLSLRELGEYLDRRWDQSLPHLPWMEMLKRAQLSSIALASLVYEQIQIMKENHALLMDFYHPLYPRHLRFLNDPPNALTMQGSIELLEQSRVGIVGSRKASAFALYESRELGREMARRACVVVSGGALGCDMAAHLGAWASEVRPVPAITIFAGGLAQLHPRTHQSYFAQLREGGALFISERLWEYPARPFDFPARNRIISGLVEQLFVMQAGERSGAKLTASIALDQGREVYVLVHPKDDVRALGSLQLIEEGAIPFLSAEDCLGPPLTLSMS